VISLPGLGVQHWDWTSFDERFQIAERGNVIGYGHVVLNRIELLLERVCEAFGARTRDTAGGECLVDELGHRLVDGRGGEWRGQRRGRWRNEPLEEVLDAVGSQPRSLTEAPVPVRRR
jgi:hypothetical protein